MCRCLFSGYLMGSLSLLTIFIFTYKLNSLRARVHITYLKVPFV